MKFSNAPIKVKEVWSEVWSEIWYYARKGNYQRIIFSSEIIGYKITNLIFETQKAAAGRLF